MPTELLAAFALVAAVYLARAVLIPVMVSVFIAALLDPWVGRLERLRLGRRAASALCVAAFLLLASAAGWLCYGVLSRTVVQLPRYSAELREGLSQLQRHAHRLEKLFGGAAGAQAEQKVHVEPNWESLIFAGLGPLFEAVAIGVFVPFLVFFLLTDKKALLGSLERLKTPLRWERLKQQAPAMVRAYFLGISLTGLGLALLQGAVFAGLGLQDAVGLGLLTGFLNLVPFLGLPLAAALPIAQALLQRSGALSCIVITACVLALHVLAGSYVIPRIMGSRLKLNTVSATLGMLFWWWLWGALGFMLAVPMTALVRILLECHPRSERVAQLLAAEERHCSLAL